MIKKYRYVLSHSTLFLFITESVWNLLNLYISCMVNDGVFVLEPLFNKYSFDQRRIFKVKKMTKVSRKKLSIFENNFKKNV